MQRSSLHLILSCEDIRNKNIDHFDPEEGGSRFLQITGSIVSPFFTHKMTQWAVIIK
jgi:hypothetical protein